MAETTEGDSIVLYLGRLLPALLALIAGLVIHSFIIGVNVTDWWKGRSVTPVDHIVTSLGITRLCAQCADTLFLFVGILSRINLSSSFTLVILDAVYSFSTYANIWLTTLLSIVLCLKISNLHTRLFLYLRRMILHRIGHFIVFLLLFSSLNGLISLLFTTTKVTSAEKCNTTMDYLSMYCIYNNTIYIVTIGYFFPLLFYSISSILLFTFLYHHTTRMKMSSNLSINLETYYSVMRFLSFTFIYNTIYFIAHVICVVYYYMYCVAIPGIYTALDFLPALHTCYIIYGTAKLRDQKSEVIHNVIGFLFQRKDTETRENIEIVGQCGK